MSEEQVQKRGLRERARRVRQMQHAAANQANRLVSNQKTLKFVPLDLKKSSPPIALNVRKGKKALARAERRERVAAKRRRGCHELAMHFVLAQKAF